jgi:tRNA G18 (ribose-2'-O)-methylase SpoU
MHDYPTSNPHHIYIAAEKSPLSIDLTQYADIYTSQSADMEHLFVIVGNEVTGVEQSTLDLVHHVVHIPMLGIKESLNVGQAAAIVMW